MEIEGPLIISVQDDETSHKRELHVAFKPGFIQQKVFERVEALQTYMDKLNHNLKKLARDNPDRIGMETVYQVCNNLLEYIREDEIDLNKTIVIEIQPSINITHFITGDSSNN